MALWSQVQSGFDADDETINFGTRVIAENNGVLYEACTIATIKSLNKVDQQPNVLASFQHSKFCVAIDKSITIFKDETCNEIICNISFPSMITCYCISKDGFFLFIVLANRILYCLHLLHGKIIFTKTISNNQNNVIKIFLEEQDEREEAFIILITNTGTIYRFSKFYPKALKLAFTNQNKTVVTEHTTNIQCSQLFEGFTSLEFFNATINTLSKDLSITMMGIHSIYTWPNKQVGEFCNVFSFGYKKIIPLYTSRKMLCLRTNHTLSIMCLNTLLGLTICEGPVYDFTVIQHDDNVNHYDILFLTQSKHNPIVYTLCLISYPEFEQKLEISVSANIYLLDISYSSNNIIYVEGIITENEVVDTFRIRTISESIPEMRLAKLLRKKQFDEAETFAKRLGLSLESIYCSKAVSLIEQLGPWATVSHSVSVDELINILDKIQDIQYVTECCNKALILNSTQMKQIYLYAQQRIMQNMKKENISNSMNTSLSSINDTLYRFETFQIIQDIETDTLSSDDAVTKEWIKFSQINLLKECITRLHMGQLDSASLIWIRHFPHIVKFVSIQTVQNIFAILPENMDPSRLWSWLTHFIPTLLSLLPDTMDEIISWGLKKLKCLEISHRTEWPDIGIDFAKKFARLFEVEDSQQSIYFHQEYRYQNSILKRFIVIVQALSDIQQLKVEYRLQISLDIYIGSPVEAIYTLLDKIHLDKILNFANTFLKQYMFNNNLQNDIVLCAYIQKTIMNSNSWWFDEEVAWEKRITIITSLIHNIEKRLEQTLAILKKAPVPWSSAIVTLAETSSNCDHSLSAKIKIEHNYVPIKLILKKYGYATIGINNKLISRIIKEGSDSMINDIEILTKNDHKLRLDSFCRCINVRLNEGNLQKTMDIIHHLENNVFDALYCYEGIVNYIVAVFSFQNVETSLICYMEILGCLEFKIHNLLVQPNVCLFHCNNIINTIKDLRSLYALKKDYKIDISLKDYRMQKSLVLENFITKLLPSMMENNLSMMHKTVIKITELLGLDRSYATLFLLEQTKDINILQLGSDNDKELNFTSSKFKNMKKICLSALRHIAVDINIAKIIKNISAFLLESCQDEDLQSALIFHTSICPSLSLQHFNVKQDITSQSSWKLYTIYEDQAISLDQRLFAFLKDAISLCLYYSEQIDNNEIASYDEQMDQLLNNFLQNITKMQLQHNDYSLLQIFKTFYFMYYSTSTRNESILTETKSILSHLLTNLLKKLCTGRLFDLQLGLSCLFILPRQEAHNWLSTNCVLFYVDHGWYSKILTLGYEYSHLEKNKLLMQKFEDYKLLHIWALQLSHYSLAYKEIFMNNASSKREILQQIINSNKDNVILLLKDYCYNFGFDFNDCLWHYLKIILETWNPTITVSNASANKELHIRTDEVHELRKKCNAIVTQIKDKSLLKRRISTLWDHIIFYYYEVFIILMDLVGDKNMEKRNYLCFLQNYIRSGPPTQMEHDEWMHLNPGHSTLPSIAQWRLPFLLKVDVWKIITPELNLKTYEKWLDIASVFNLETHLICTLAIKGEVTHVWENNTVKSQNSTWSLYPENTTLLENIKKCIQRISDSNGFYYGTAALYYVVNHTPPGADRVAAVKECYEYAQRAVENSTQFEEGMLEKIKSKYLRFTSEHILRTYGLEKDKYLGLIDNPCKLIYELYNDESIPSRYQIATNYKPNINAAVNKLGELFSLNTTKLRLDLLQEWLQSNAKSTEMYQSFTETVSALKGSNWDTDCEDNLLKMCYVIEYGDTDLFAQFLINIGFGDPHGKTEYNCNVRYRVLRVLQTVVDTATLEELTKRDVCTFRKYTNLLYYVSKLESLGLCYSVETFETCCKRELIQIVWTRLRHLPHALSVITQICIEFKLYDSITWNDILNQMTKLRMTSELKKVLLQLRSENTIVCCNGYKMGWQLIISEPFREMNVNPSPEQINNCIEALCLLYLCPMPHELEFTTIVRNSFQCEQAHLAAALLPFLDDLEKKFVLETINQQYKIAKLEENLHHLSTKGVLTITRSLAIIQKSLSWNKEGM